MVSLAVEGVRWRFVVGIFAVKGEGGGRAQYALSEVQIYVYISSDGCAVDQVDG